MKIVENGHIYQLVTIGHVTHQELAFRNTEPGKESLGTSNQEVLRVLIDRMMYLNGQLPHQANLAIIHHLRMALALHEARTLERKVQTGKLRPEEIQVSAADGHFIWERVGHDTKSKNKDQV